MLNAVAIRIAQHQLGMSSALISCTAGDGKGAGKAGAAGRLCFLSCLAPEDEGAPHSIRGLSNTPNGVDFFFSFLVLHRKGAGRAGDAGTNVTDLPYNPTSSSGVILCPVMSICN